MTKLQAVALYAAAAIVVRADIKDARALAERTYDYVVKSVSVSKLASLRAQLDAAQTEAEVRAVRRKILFMHPDLQFDKLLVCQRGVPYNEIDPHMVDQYLGRYAVPGPGLVILENWKDSPKKVQPLKDKLPRGTILNPNLHWDGLHVVFAYCAADPAPDADQLKLMSVPHFVHGTASRPDFKWLGEQSNYENPIFRPDGIKNKRWLEAMHRRYFIYEAALDGSWVRQLTGGKGDPMTTQDGRQTVLIEDVDPCYLPDGGIAFISTRCQNFGRCHWARYAPSFLLYRMEGDGSNIRPLSFGEANESRPTVLDDGRILYTRWDYINRNAVWYQSLWTTRPDGTAVAHYYGNYTENPCVTVEAQQIPGTAKTVFTAAAHHYFTAGSLAIVDPRKGEDDLTPLTRLTPETPFIEGEGWDLKDAWCSPMPVNDTLFFASRSCEPLRVPPGSPNYHHAYGAWPSRAAYGVWLVDTLGGRELIYKDDEFSCFNPIPIVERRKPPVLASVLPKDAPPEGVFYLDNVYDSRVNIPKGSVKALRINKFINLPACRRPTNHLGLDLELYRESLGVVPVAEDGSCAFKVPSGVPLQLQALDKDGVAIMTMRSFIYTQSGEIQGCTGCHEQRAAARVRSALPKSTVVHTPQKELDLGYSGAISFQRTIQPILDKHCIKCHGLDPQSKAPSFIGDDAQRALVFNENVTVPISYRETGESRPYDYYAGASPLTKRLRANHGNANLSPLELKTMLFWMDMQPARWCFTPGYSHNTPESRSVDDAAVTKLRQAIKATLGDAVAVQPFDALVNRGDETKSRILWLVPENEREKFLALVKATLVPLKAHDIAGTCGRDDECVCNSCWVRRSNLNAPKK